MTEAVEQLVLSELGDLEIFPQKGTPKVEVRMARFCNSFCPSQRLLLFRSGSVSHDIRVRLNEWHIGKVKIEKYCKKANSRADLLRFGTYRH